MNNDINVLTFDGVPLNRERAYYFPSYDNLDAPDKDVDTEEIPGRNGELIMKGSRFKNRDLEYHCISFEGVEYYRWVRNLLLSVDGYHRLEDSFDPDVFRMVRCTDISEDDVYPDVIKFGLKFDAKPQRYIKSGEQEIAVNGSVTLYNPTMYDALPLITVVGKGTLTIGNDSFVCSEGMIIDSEQQDCYDSAGANLNGSFTLNGADFPKLYPGENNISYSGFSSVSIKPRWWEL